MIMVDIKTLLECLNPYCTRALEGAAGLCVSRTHYEVTVDHFLSKLLEEGERPERILGGLRYAWERDAASPLETRRRLKALLTCDIEIKTGKIKPVFALERLVIKLCGLRNSFR